MPQQVITTVPIRQTKFSNGVISGSMFGDVSHPKFASSLRTCQNWLPTPQGALVNRPGSKLVAPVKDSTKLTRLLPFVFADSQTFVIESGNLYMRFFQTGKYVGVDGALHTYGDAYAGGSYELVTPYSTAMLPFLKKSQIGDTVTLTYGGQGPAFAVQPNDLTHASGALTPWAIAGTNVKIPIFTAPNTLSVNVLAWNPATVYKSGDMASQNNVLWLSIQGNNTGAPNSPPAPVLNAAQTGLQGNLFWTPAIDPDHPAITVVWQMTFVAQDPNGITYESAPSGSLVGTGPISLDRRVPLTYNGLSAALPAGWNGLFLRLYRATAGGIFGWVRDYPFTTAAFNFDDDGRAQDFSQQPPAGTNPFFYPGTATFSYPAVSGTFDQRRLFAGSLLIPQGIWLSRDGDFYNWDRLSPGADTDAMFLVAVSEVLEQVRAFVPLRRGLVLTGQGEWALSGMNGGPISKASKDFKRQSKWGSSWLDPIVVGTGILFITAKSNMVRDLYPLYGIYADFWDGQEISFMARDLFDLYTITDWAFQSTPYPVVWAVRSDGALLSLTYQHAPASFGQQLAEGVAGWAVHVTGGSQSDKYEAVCVVPEPPEDAVYVVVNRNGTRLIERMNNPVCPASPFTPGVSDPRYGVYLDSAVTYDGHNLGATTMQLSGGPYVAGAQVVCTASTPQFAAADEDPAAPSAVVFEPETANHMSCKVVHFTDTTHVLVELPADLTAAQVAAWATATTTAWGLAKSTIAVAHLAAYPLDTLDANGARGVGVLVDGDLGAPLSFVAGVLTLAAPGLVICAGLSYNADVALLDAHHPNADIRNRQKKLVRIGFEVAGARGVWAGADFDKLWEWAQRQVRDEFGRIPLATGYFETEVTDSWDKGGRAAFRHIEPLPVTLVAALREYELGGT